jgi:AraC-like DNA-binding protein
MKLYIRHMACESCKVLVKEELIKLGKQPTHVELGEVDVKEKLSEKEKKQFSAAIKKAGLELTNNKEGMLVDNIKATITDYVVNAEQIKSNLSTYLSKKLNYDYAYMSSYFSAMQATTIEQFAISLKIEKAKEMLAIDGLTLTEIADKLNYSSVAHLSAQFKKVTGLSASHFKNLNKVRRITIQNL